VTLCAGVRFTDTLTAGFTQQLSAERVIDIQPFHSCVAGERFALPMKAALAALQPRLATDAWVYVESPAGTVPPVPPGWALHREGQTRDVRYALYRAPAPQGAGTLRHDDSPATTE